MKKIYFLILILALLAYTNQSKAQAGSVVLIPAGGAQVLYPSITSAYAAIPAAPALSYTIELLPPYNGTDASEVYPIQLTDKGLTPGSTVTITIRPAAGNNGETIQRPVAAAGVVLQFNGADNVILDGRPGSIASAASNYLTVNDPFVGSNTNRNIELINAANNNTIQYVNCTAADATAAGAGNRTILIGSTTTTGNNNNTIQNCMVSGGLRGIQDFGLSDAVPNNGSKILNNTVSNFGAIGIFAGTGQSNITINNNTVLMVNYNHLVAGTIVGIQQQSLVAGTTSIANNTISLSSTSGATTGVTGIVDIAVGTENIQSNTIARLTAPLATTLIGIGTYSNGVTTFNVLNNIISNLSGPAATTVWAAFLSSAATPAATLYNYRANKITGLTSGAAANIRGMSIFPAMGSTLNVYNNFVAITDSNATAAFLFGILFGNTGNNYTSNIYYNSVKLGGKGSDTTINSFSIYRSDTTATSVYNQKNNILVTDRNGSIAFFNISTSGTLAIDYNNYYANGATASYAAATAAAVYLNSELAAYKTTVSPQEQNTTFNNVSFVSNTDLHLTGTSVTDVNLKGTPIAGITTDIDGQTRSATAPTKGADEPGQTVPVELLTFAGTAKGTYNQLNWSTASENNNAGFELQRSADGRYFTALTFVSSKAVNGNSTVALNYNFDDVKPFTSNSFYRLRQTDKDGRSTYSAIVSIKGKGVLNLQITNLYPNPVKDHFNVIVAAKDNSTIAVSVTDINGKLVIQKMFAIKAGDNILSMGVGSLNAGVYSIKVLEQKTGETATLKFMK